MLKTKGWWEMTSIFKRNRKEISLDSVKIASWVERLRVLAVIIGVLAIAVATTFSTF
jgi:aryl carrier-like protein